MACTREGLHAECGQRNRRISLQGGGCGAALSRDAQFRVRQYRRLLSLSARRSASPVHRYRRRSAARHGIPEREGPPGGRAIAVRDQLRLREVVAAADQIQLYKLICRQVATKMGLTASFLPKPVVGVNGSGMHTNVSISKDGKNLFWDPKGEENLSKLAWDFIDRILTHGNDICLLLNASVNAYRRLDPHFEAPTRSRPPLSIAAPWSAFRSATRRACAWKSAPSAPTRIPTWCSTRFSRPASMANREDQQSA